MKEKFGTVSLFLKNGPEHYPKEFLLNSEVYGKPLKFSKQSSDMTSFMLAKSTNVLCWIWWRRKLEK